MSPEEFILGAVEATGNVNFNTVMILLGILFFLFWMIVVGWVWVDAGERSSNGIFKLGSAVTVGILGVVGLIIYLIIRPKQTIQEIYWSDLERRYLKYETAELDDCSNCGYQLQPGFVSCPECKEIVKVKCSGCDVHIDRDWKYCPFCSKKNGSAIGGDDEYISDEEMERKVQESKDDAVRAVEANMTRYAEKSGFAVAVGNSVLSGVRGWGKKVDGAFRGKKKGKKKKVSTKKKK